jgi:hypothetical protein
VRSRRRTVAKFPAQAFGNFYTNPDACLSLRSRRKNKAQGGQPWVEKSTREQACETGDRFEKVYRPFHGLDCMAALIPRVTLIAPPWALFLHPLRGLKEVFFASPHQDG